MENRDFEVNGKNLSGVIFYPPVRKEKNPAILFVHGWTSEKARSYQYAKSLADLGYICYLFDMRGHGQSEGNRMKMTNKDFLDDVLSAYDFLSQLQYVSKNNISVVGNSFGGYLVSLLTSKRKVKKLVLRAPADYKNEVFEQLKKATTGNDTKVMEWREKIKNFNETHALEAIHNFNGNILVIESELDDRVPNETLKNYMNAVKDKTKLTHIVMKGAPHSIKDGKFRDQVEKILLDFFKTV